MMLPDRDRARVDRAKITDYLLSLSHPDGRGKAAFFMRFGFKARDWEALADALREVAVRNLVTAVAESAHGTRHCGRSAPYSGRTRTASAYRMDCRAG